MTTLPDYSEHSRHDYEICFQITMKMSRLAKIAGRNEAVKIVQDLPGAKK